MVKQLSSIVQKQHSNARDTGCLKKNFLLPNLAFANIAVDGEKSNNSVLTNPVVLYLLS